MMRVRSVVSLLAYTLLVAQYSGLRAQGAASRAGISANQMRSFAQQLPDMSGRIQGLQIVRGGRQPLISVATFSVDDGWQLFLFGAAGDGRFSERWHSGKLPYTFRVSSPGALQTFLLGSEGGIEFQGCAAHSCPEVFSILLYVPSINKEFVVTSVYGKTKYSRDALLPQNLRYKKALDQLLKGR